MKRATLVLVTTLLLLGLNAARAINPTHRTIDGLPEYVRQIDGEFLPDGFDLPDSVFYDISGRAIFIVNRYYLRPNDPFINQLRDSVLPEIKQRDLELAGLLLRGAASPEGPYNNNVMLSRNRAKALINFIGKEIDQDVDTMLATSTMAEDYRYLLLMLRESDDVDYERVARMLEPLDGNPQACKAALQKADGGRLWRRLLREYFPALRAARIVMFFREKYPRIKTLDEISVTPTELSINWEPLPKAEPSVSPWPARLERPHMLSVSSNLLFDGFYLPNYGWAPSPNIGVEFYPPKSQWTAFAEFTFPYYHRWHKHKFYQIRDYHLEGRYYFDPGKTHKGPFVAAYANANIYGIGFSKTKGWEGEGIGAAVKGGYVLPIGRQGRWRLEFSAAFGGYWTKFDPYVYGNPVTGTEDGKYYYDYTGPVNRFKKRNHSRWWIGPTELTITLRYDLLYYRLIGKGATTRRYLNIVY